MKSVVKKQIYRFSRSVLKDVFDDVIVEEPLELFINQSHEPLLITMRTPGEDRNLTIGLLFTLEVIHDVNDIISIQQINSSQIRIFLREGLTVKPKGLLTNSSCGLCNGNSWEEIASHSNYPIFDKSIQIKLDVIAGAHQSLVLDEDHFTLTGGNHKVLLLDFNGNSTYGAEDVGRHNAFDKVLGLCLSEQKIPLSHFIAVLSGRCSYEMCLKAWQGGIPLIISRGAPTSKAIELADAAGITLIGFARSESFNIYTHSYRIKDEGK